MTQKKTFLKIFGLTVKNILPPSLWYVNARREVIFMRIKASKLLAAVLALCLTLGTAPAASAAALPQSAPGSQDITPYFLYIKGQDCILDISGRTAYINAWVSGQTSVATKCKVRAELQEKASAYAWTLVDSWTDQQNGDWAEVDETASVTPGNTYRVKVTVTVWAGSQSESKTFYSNEVEA